MTIRRQQRLVLFSIGRVLHRKKVKEEQTCGAFSPVTSDKGRVLKLRRWRTVFCLCYPCLTGSRTWITGYLTKENTKNVPEVFIFEREGGSCPQDTEAGNLAELDFYKIIEISIFIYDCLLEQVITGEYVFCDQLWNRVQINVKLWGR